MRSFFPLTPKRVYYILYERKKAVGRRGIEERVEAEEPGNYFYKSAVGKLGSPSLSLSFLCSSNLFSLFTISTFFSFPSLL